MTKRPVMDFTQPLQEERAKPKRERAEPIPAIPTGPPNREPFRIERVFDIQFNDYQLKHYWGTRTFVGFPKGILKQREIDEAREWLANHNRREGRTTLLALCFIEKAVEHPGTWVYFLDHMTTQSGIRSLERVLRDLLDRHPLFRAKIEWHHNDNAFKFQGVTDGGI